VCGNLPQFNRQSLLLQPDNSNSFGQSVQAVLTPSIRESLLPKQSQSHFTTDGQSVSPSWCQAPSGAHDQIFIYLFFESYCPVYMGPLSDERTGLSFVCEPCLRFHVHLGVFSFRYCLAGASILSFLSKLLDHVIFPHLFLGPWASYMLLLLSWLSDRQDKYSWIEKFCLDGVFGISVSDISCFWCGSQERSPRLA
jgi:hypothetical protein